MIFLSIGIAVILYNQKKIRDKQKENEKKMEEILTGIRALALEIDCRYSIKQKDPDE